MYEQLIMLTDHACIVWITTVVVADAPIPSEDEISI